jgi:hypothetical protein
LLRRFASVKDKRIPSIKGKIEKSAMMRRVGRRRARPLFSWMIRGLTSGSCLSIFCGTKKGRGNGGEPRARVPD